MNKENQHSNFHIPSTQAFKVETINSKLSTLLAVIISFQQKVYYT
jgi:hypothetical protein